MVLEIIAGIVIGPSVLGLVEVDQSIEVVALIGLAFVLFLAGARIELDKLRGQALRLTAAGFALSFALALVVGIGLGAVGLVETPLIVAIILCATSTGGPRPVHNGGDLHDIPAADHRRRHDRRLRQRSFCCHCSSRARAAWAPQLLLGARGVLAVVVYLALRGAELDAHPQRTSCDFRTDRADPRAGRHHLFVGFAAVAEALGLEVILGAFIAGTIVSLLPRGGPDPPRLPPQARGDGVPGLIPVFFVTSGVRYDLHALLADASNLAMLPIFLAALVVVRGCPHCSTAASWTPGEWRSRL